MLTEEQELEAVKLLIQAQGIIDYEWMGSGRPGEISSRIEALWTSLGYEVEWGPGPGMETIRRVRYYHRDCLEATDQASPADNRGAGATDGGG